MSNELTAAEVAELKQLREEKAKREAAELSKKSTGYQTSKAISNGCRLNVGEKGGVSVYGLNSRFPVTLTTAQWDIVGSLMGEIKAFSTENAALIITRTTEAKNKPKQK